MQTASNVVPQHGQPPQQPQPQQFAAHRHPLAATFERGAAASLTQSGSSTTPRSSGPSGGCNYTLIETPELVESLCRQIWMCYPPPILGLDCEGLIKGKPIALLQLSFQEHSYVFDLLRVNPFDHHLSFNLKQILTADHIVKIFHDFCEDCSALINQHGVRCNSVFDTQIAHRVICTVTQSLGNGSNENQIGLNTLLQKYLGDEVRNTEKKEVSRQMKQDETFWHTVRPLSEQMLEYAAQDVIFLPRVYEKMQQFLPMPCYERHINARGEMTFEHITVQAKIFNDTRKCLQYAMINNDIKEITQLDAGHEIVAFIKNYRRDVIFCSLNLGVSGVIRDPASRNTLEKFNSFGDLVYVILHGFERHKGQAILSFSRQFNHHVVGYGGAAAGYPMSPFVHQQPQQAQQMMFQAAAAQAFHRMMGAGFQHQQQQSPIFHHPPPQPLSQIAPPTPAPTIHHQPPQSQQPFVKQQAANPFLLQQKIGATQQASTAMAEVVVQQQPSSQQQQVQFQQHQHTWTPFSANPGSITANSAAFYRPPQPQQHAHFLVQPPPPHNLVIQQQTQQTTESSKFATTFSKSLTLSEPEAEQSFNNDTSDDSSFQSMNLMATAFVPTTPKAEQTHAAVVPIVGETIAKAQTAKVLLMDHHQKQSSFFSEEQGRPQVQHHNQQQQQMMVNRQDEAGSLRPQSSRQPQYPQNAKTLGAGYHHHHQRNSHHHQRDHASDRGRGVARRR